MANLFKKAAAKAEKAPEPAKKKKETCWRVGGDPQGAALAEAISELVALQSQSKGLENRMNLYKKKLKEYAEERWLEQYGGQGIQPETPMKLVNATTGESVTFVVQDRSLGNQVKDEIAEALVQLLGEGGAEEALFEQTLFGFNPLVMAQPLANGAKDKESGVTLLVQDWLGEKLGLMVERAIKEGVLTEEQAEHLLEVKQQRTFRPGFFDKLPHLCGLNVGRVTAVLGSIGSAIVRYVKA